MYCRSSLIWRQSYFSQTFWPTRSGKQPLHCDRKWIFSLLAMDGNPWVLQWPWLGSPMWRNTHYSQTCVDCSSLYSCYRCYGVTKPLWAFFSLPKINNRKNSEIKQHVQKCVLTKEILNIERECSEISLTKPLSLFQLGSCFHNTAYLVTFHP